MRTHNCRRESEARAWNDAFGAHLASSVALAAADIAARSLAARNAFDASTISGCVARRPASWLDSNLSSSVKSPNTIILKLQMHHQP